MTKSRLCVRALRVNVTRLVAALLLCDPFQIANGQTTTATLFGVVRDDSGSVMPGVKITAANTAMSFVRTASSDQTGGYLLTNLPVGPYSFVVEKEGFRRFV
jgi:Carboxypeptidase regulatory-like domain